MFWCFNPALNVPQEDEKFLTEVFAQLTDDATEDSKRRELASFKKFFFVLVVFFFWVFLDICWNLKVVAFHNHVWEMSPEMAVGTVIFIWDRFNYFDLCISHLYCHLSISFFSPPLLRWTSSKNSVRFHKRCSLKTGMRSSKLWQI